MTTQVQIDVAARMGERAGQSFLDTGVWPRCPFRTAALEPVAAAWSQAVFSVVGAALRAGRAAQ